MAETSAGNFFSPGVVMEALIMLPVAITLDIIGIVLVCFALDDFWITDIIGLIIIGGWSLFRSQFKDDKESAVGMPDREERKKQAQQIQQAPKEAEAAKTTKTGKATKAAKSFKWAKWLKFLEFVPYLGVLPFWTISVFFELKE